jgi:hypothetical protein
MKIRQYITDSRRRACPAIADDKIVSATGTNCAKRFALVGMAISFASVGMAQQAPGWDAGPTLNGPNNAPVGDLLNM